MRIEDKKDDIEGALRGYAETPELVRNELTEFSSGFSGFMETLEKMQKGEGFEGIIPKEVEENGLDAADLDGVKEALLKGMTAPQIGQKAPFIPVMELDRARKQVRISLKRIPSSTDTPDSFDDDMKIMSGALKYLHSSATRLKCFPHVYEFIKAFALCYAPEAKPSVDKIVVARFLDSAPLKLSVELEERILKNVFREDKTQTILLSMMKVKNVTEDGFRAWLDSFQPEKHQVPWHNRLRAIVAERTAEKIAQFKKKFLETVPDKVKLVQGVQKESPLVARPLRAPEENSPVKRNTTAIKDKVVLATANAWFPAGNLTGHVVPQAAGKSRFGAPLSKETSVVVGRIINVGDTNAEKVASDKDAAAQKEATKIMEKLAATLALSLGGEHSTFALVSAICELVFGDSIPWVKGRKVDWRLLIDKGHVLPFANLYKGHDEDLSFINELFAVRKELEEKGLRTPGIRKLFMKKLSAKTK